jgi:hypothetical protein
MEVVKEGIWKISGEDQWEDQGSSQVIINPTAVRTF